MFMRLDPGFPSIYSRPIFTQKQPIGSQIFIRFLALFTPVLRLINTDYEAALWDLFWHRQSRDETGKQ